MTTAAKESFAQRQFIFCSGLTRTFTDFLFSDGPFSSVKVRCFFTLYEVCTALNLLEHGLSQS